MRFLNHKELVSVRIHISAWIFELFYFRVFFQPIPLVLVFHSIRFSTGAIRDLAWTKLTLNKYIQLHMQYGSMRHKTQQAGAVTTHHFRNNTAESCNRSIYPDHDEILQNLHVIRPKLFRPICDLPSIRTRYLIDLTELHHSTLMWELRVCESSVLYDTIHLLSII